MPVPNGCSQFATFHVDRSLRWRPACTGGAPAAPSVSSERWKHFHTKPLTAGGPSSRILIYYIVLYYKVMRVVRFRQGTGEARTGFLQDDQVFDVPGPMGAIPLELVLEGGSPDLISLREMATGATRRDLASVTLLPPIATPPKILCVGQNFAAHAGEVGVENPSEPLFFSKLSSSITGPHDPILLPAAAPRRVDYEAELVVVIGRRGRDIREDRALDNVAGYMVGNDVSARDWQTKKPGGQWLLGKSFDTFLPLGPALITPDEVGELDALRITCRVSGETVQDDTVGHMIFPIPYLISYISQVAMLMPGDLIMTGTPAGVGMSRVPPRWLRDGDTLETEVVGLGALCNTVRTTGTSG